MNSAAPVSHALEMLRALLPTGQEMLVHVSQRALGALSAGAAPSLLCLSLWGCGGWSPARPCPGLTQATPYPMQCHHGGETAPRGLAPRAPLCFLVREQMVSCRDSCLPPGLQLQPQESSKRKLSSPRQQAGLALRPGPSPVLSLCPPPRGSPLRPSRAPHPSLLPRRQPRRS